MNAPKPKAGQLGTREILWQAIQELSSANKVFSRQRLAAMTGVRLSQIDDHCERFRDAGLIVKVVNGCYELVPEFPEPQPISYTPMVGGMVKLERADSIWTLTPAEVRLLAKMLAGWANELASTEQITEISHTVNRLEQDVRVLRRNSRATPPAARVTNKGARHARLKAVTVA